MPEEISASREESGKMDGRKGPKGEKRIPGRQGGKTLFRDPRAAFYVISALGLISFIFLSFYYGRPAYVWMVQENQPGIRFTDYFMHLTAAVDRQHLYQNITDARTGCFPPLAYVMYYLLYRLTPLAFETVQHFEEMEQIPGTLHVFTYYLIFSALLLYIGISKTGQRSTRRDAGIFTLLMASAVFAGSGYMMGNSSMLVLGLLTLALAFRDSPSRGRREAALVLFAVCVGFKLYPAVFGLIYLKEKRYRELGRLVLYSLALVFLPFAFFGGAEGLSAWMGHILENMRSSPQYDFGRLQYLKGALFTVIRLLTGQEAGTAASILTWLICAFWAVMAWRSESAPGTWFFLICIMVFFPSNAFRYSLSYFAIPLITWLKTDPFPEMRGGAWWGVMGLYGLLYTVPVWWIAVDGLEKWYDVYALTSVEICLYLTAYALILLMSALALRPGKKGRTAGRKPG